MPALSFFNTKSGVVSSSCKRPTTGLMALRLFTLVWVVPMLAKAQTLGQENCSTLAWLYLEQGEIRAVEPSSGQLGSVVTLTGDRLLGGGAAVASVTLAGVAVKQILHGNDSVVVVIADAAASAENGDVVIQADTGALSTRTGGWTYLSPGIVDSVDPVYGQVGTLVTLRGSGFMGAGSGIERVMLAGRTARIIGVGNDTFVVLEAAASNTTGPGDIVIVASNHIQTIKEKGWSYRTQGTISGLSPEYGVKGTETLIFGSNLRGHGTRVRAVTLDGVPVAAIVQESDFFVRVIADEGTPGPAGDVVLTADTGAIVQLAEAWSYVGAANISSVQPDVGAAGTIVTIQGTNLLSGGTAIMTVTLAQVGAVIRSANDTVVIVQAGVFTGDQTTGAVHLTTDTGVQTVKPSAWTYLASSEIFQVAPARGHGGTRVTISGLSLLAGSSVKRVTLAGVPAAEIIHSSDTKIVVVATAHTASSGAVVVELLSGASVTRKAGWVYESPAALQAITPASGQIGTIVTVSGTGLLMGGATITGLTLAGEPVERIVSANDTEVVAIAASNSTTTTGPVHIEANTGAFTQGLSWRYLLAGTILTVIPDSGQGGTIVTVSGERLRGGGASVVSLTLAGQPATILSQTSSSVVLRASVAPAGLGDVHIVSNTGARTTLIDGWLYRAPGEITAVQPESGQEGTLVTIHGSELLGGGQELDVVLLDNVTAIILHSNDTMVVVRATAAVSSGGRAVTLIADSGATVFKATAWSYLIAGVIADFTPNSGQQGTEVNITGERLFGGGSAVVSVTLSGVPAVILSQSETSVVVQAEHSAPSSGLVTIYADTGAIIISDSAWSYVAVGQIDIVTPGSGQWGTFVTIQGERLTGSGSHVIAVHLDGVAVMDLVSQNSTVVIVRAARGNASLTAGSVQLIADTGALVTANASWSYLEEGNILSISPEVGQAGTVVEVRGERLFGASLGLAKVLLRDVEAEILFANDSLVLVAAGGSSLAGLGDVLLLGTAGSLVSAPDAFTYSLAGQIDAVEPDSGQFGTWATITGAGLLGGGSQLTQVTLAGVPVLTIGEHNHTHLLVRADVGEVGTGSIRLTADTGAVTELTDGWTYTSPSHITSVSPASGQRGTRIQIAGEFLLGSANGTHIVSVTLAGQPADVLQGTSQTLVVVEARQNGTLEVGDVIVTAFSGAMAVLSNAWRYLTEGQITVVEPAAGQAGTRITLTGRGLRGGGAQVTNVTVGGVLATIVTEDDEVVVVRAGVRSAGPADIVLTADTGAVVSGEDLWTFLEPSEIYDVSPSSGQFGTLVTISGRTLHGEGENISTVTLAGQPAQLVFVSSSVVTVAAAYGSVGVGDVVVTSTSGATTVYLDGWRYLLRGEISVFEPSSGRLGTFITINGTSLRGGGAEVVQVLVNEVAAAIEYESDTQVVVRAGQGPLAPAAGVIVLVADTGARTTSADAWNYLGPGSISTVSPSSGRLGTKVTVFGLDLCGGGTRIVQVMLAGLEADLVTQDCGRVTIIARDYGASKTGPVTLIADTGARIISGNAAWTYVAQGNITQVYPNAGQVPTRITITGHRLFSGGSSVASVVVGGKTTFVDTTVSNDTYVEAVLQTLASGTVDVVITSDTGASVRAENAFTFSIVESVTPAYGQGLARVTVRGIALLAGGSSVASVRFVGINVREIVSFNESVGVVLVEFENVASDRTGDITILMENGQVVTAVNRWTYKVMGTIALVTPAYGQAGTRVTISGTNLLGHGNSLFRATLAGTAAEILSANATQVILQASAASAGLGDVALVADTGALVQRTGAWTYLTPQSIDAVTPNYGQKNTRVTITGVNLLGGGATLQHVTLAGIRTTTFLFISNTEIVVEAAASSPTALGAVVVTADTGAAVAKNESWLYEPAGNITLVDPTSGQFGTIVVISGIHLRSHADAVASVLLHGVNATIISENNTVVVVKANGGNDGTGSVLLIATSGATTELQDAWSYVVPGAITTVRPSSGIGGTLVTINGTNLFGGGLDIVAVTLNGVPVSQIIATSPSSIVVEAGSTGTSVDGGEVLIIADTGAQTTKTDGWVYLFPGNLSGVTPARGRAGTVIQLTGTNLLGGGASAATVLFGADTVEAILFANDTLVEVVAATGATPDVAVDIMIVADTGARVALVQGFTPIAAGLIQTIVPAAGGLGTFVTILGQDLIGVGTAISKVTLAGIAVREIVSYNSTTVVVRAGEALNASTGDVLLTADTGDRVWKTNGWTYLAPAGISNVSRFSGPVGTQVYISVTNLMSDADPLVSVTFANIPVLNFTVLSNNRVVVAAGDGTMETGAIVLTVASGAQAIADTDWTFEPAGAVDAIDPTSGQAGSIINIFSGSGSSFLGGGTAVISVTLAGLPVEEILISNDTFVQVRAAFSDTAKIGDVVLRSDAGALTVASDVWAYLAPGRVTQRSPSFGQGGTETVLEGEHLLGYGTSLVTALLAGVEATVLFANDTQVRLRAGPSNATTGDITLISNVGIRVSFANGWTYRLPGKIADVSPASGQRGTRAIVYGSHLRGHGNRVVQVTLAGQVATIVQESNFFVELIAPEGPAGQNGHVRVIADTGAVVEQTDGWTFLAPANITDVTPSSGAIGTRVTLAGTHLLAGGLSITRVSLGSATAQVLSASNSEIVVRVVESQAAGTVTITIVVDTGATAFKENGFTFVAAGDIHAVVPKKGQAGTRVTISGVNLLAGGTEVVSLTLAEVAVREVVSASNTLVVVVAEGYDLATLGDVLITVESGAYIKRSKGWTYLPSGQVLEIQPTSGQEGTIVTIRGLGLLQGGTTLVGAWLAGVAVEAVDASNDTHIIVRAGRNTTFQTGDVRFVVDSGAELATGNWSYLNVSTITAVQPDNGQTGTLVTIIGWRLYGGGSSIDSVQLAGVVATIISQTASQIVVRASSSAIVGAGHVVLTADSGARTTAEGAWTYNTPGAIAAVVPNSGQRGTVVMLTGFALLGGGSEAHNVSLAGVSAEILFSNASLVEVRAAAGVVAGSGEVAIIANTGAIVTLQDGWTYMAEGNITQVNPAYGQMGTVVNLTGTNLLGSSSTLVRADIAGVMAEILSQSDNYVSLRVGNVSMLGVSDIILTAASGAVVERLGGFEVRAQGVIEIVAPANGQYFTLITIVGQRLRGHGPTVSQVLFGNVASPHLISESDTQVVARVPRHTAGLSVDLTLVSSSGATVVGDQRFTFLQEGNITALEPDSGHGGTWITIHGDGLLGGGTRVHSVTLAGESVALIVSYNDTMVQVQAAHVLQGGHGPVVIESDTGALVTGVPSFTYHDPGVVVALVPNHGQLGTLVTIVGQGLLGGGTAIVHLHLSGVAVLTIISQNETAIVVRAGASADIGLGNVTIESNTGAVVVGHDAWQYGNASIITSVQPSSGILGTYVTILGERFLGVDGAQELSAVTLAGQSAHIVRASHSEILVRALHRMEGTGDIQVVVSSGAITLAVNAWQYLASGSIDSVDPNNGQENTVVSIRGSGLLGGGSRIEQVTLAGINVSIIVSSDNSLVVVVVAAAEPTFGDIIMVADTGAMIVLEDGWTYGNYSRILSVNPSQGQFGTLVTISGELLRGGGSAVVNVSLVGLLATVISQSDHEVVVSAALRASNETITGGVVVNSDSGATATLLAAFTYLPQSRIHAVTPAIGQGGTYVVIDGEHLLGGGFELKSAWLADVSATIINSSSTQVVLRAAPGPSGGSLGKVVLMADTGATVTAADAFRYLVPGAISLVTPNQGQAGTVVTLIGERLCGGGSAVSRIWLAGFEATLVRQEDCQLVVVTARDYGINSTGDVLLESNTGAQVLRSNAWTYISNGFISSVSHRAGQAGTTVTLTGEELFGGGTSATSVTFAGVPALIVGTATDPTQLVAQVNPGPPIGQARLGDIVITGNTGVTVRKINAWTYSVIDSITPDSGQHGTNVTIRGDSLLASDTSPATVTLAGVLVQAILFYSDTELVVVTASNAIQQDQMGSVVINMPNQQQVVSSSQAFLYKVPGSISTVTPAQGQKSTLVTIRGTELLGYGSVAVDIWLAGTLVQEIVRQNSSEMVVRAGASKAKVGAVLIQSDTGAMVQRADSWTYVVAGNITAVNPSSGQFRTQVTITGTNLYNGAEGISSVTLDGVTVLEIVSTSNTQVVVVASASAASGPGDVVVVSADGASTVQQEAFTYLLAGLIESVNPAVGQIGTVVTITGERLLGGAATIASVTLNSVPATVVFQNDSLVLVVAGNGSAVEGTGDVVLTAATGAQLSLSNGFTYLVAGIITAIFPASGQAGTRVLLTGTNLLGGGDSLLSVTLAGVKTAQTVSFNETHIEVVAAASLAAVGSVVVTANTGAQSGAIGGWEYLPAGNISNVTPESGQWGTVVTLNGQGLLGGGATVVQALLGGQPATVLSVNGDTEVVLRASAAPASSGVVRLEADTGAVVEWSGLWTYLQQSIISAFTPLRGSNGTLVSLIGERLLGGGMTVSSVTLAGIPVRRILSQNDTVVVVEADGSSSALVNATIQLETDSGALTSIVGWEYVEPTIIAAVTPSFGRTGTRVTIDGRELLGGAESLTVVYLAGVPTTNILEVSDVRIVVVAAEHEQATAGSLIIEASSGSRTILEDSWQYMSAGQVDMVQPNSGVVGTVVTLTGQYLLGGGKNITAVYFGATPASRVLFFNDSLVVAAVAYSEVGADQDITLVADTGAIVVSTATWTYLAVGNITYVEPTFGQFGTRVTVVGENLLSYGTLLSSAFLAGVSANITSFSNTEVVLVAGESHQLLGDVLLVADTAGQVVGANLWQYREGGRVLAVSPASGHFGTDVILFGENLLGHGNTPVQVTLAGVNATVTFASASILQVKAGAGSLGSGGIQIVADTGAIVQRADGWSYVVPGSITALNPTSGHLGTFVDIFGVGLLAGGTSVKSVSLAGSLAKVVSFNSTLVRVQAMRDVGTLPGDVVITVNTGAEIMRPDAWRFVQPGDVDGVVPSSGQFGTRVTLSGENLLAGGSAIVSVTLAGSEVTEIVTAINTKIVVVAAAGLATTGNIVITADTGAFIVQKNGWTYISPGTIDTVSPLEGQVGTIVVLNGSNLLGGGSSITEVTIAGKAVLSIESFDSHRVVVRASASNVTRGPIVLTADTGAVIVSEIEWTYLQEGIIATVSPGQGQGGTFVVITGERLRGGGSALVSASLAGVNASIEAESDTQLILRAGAGPAYSVQGHVVLTADTGALLTLENAWTYNEPGVITAVTPNNGQLGSRVTLEGSGLLGGGASVANVTLNGVVAILIHANDTMVVVVAQESGPANNTPAVILADTGALVILEEAFTYSLAGEITHVTPSIGQVGTYVTVKGVGLRGSGSAVEQVMLGLVQAELVSESDTVVVVRAAASWTVGDVDVLLIADTAATVTQQAGFYYATAGVIEALSPAEGQFGTIITISGTNLRGSGAAVVAVTLGGASVLEIVAENNTAVVVVANVSNAAVNTSVVLTADTGAVVQLEAAWTYLVQGVIESVSPSNGQVGTRVEITGQRLLGGGVTTGTVMIGDAAATVLLANDTVLVVQAGAGSVTNVSADIRITSDTGSMVWLPTAFMYMTPSVISSVTPSAGQLGTFVQIYGENLLSYGVEVTSVTMAGVPVLELVSATDSLVRVRAGNSFVLGSGDVVVRSDTGAQAVLVDGFEYDSPSNITGVNVCF